MSDKINIEIIYDFDVSIGNIQDLKNTAQVVLRQNSVSECDANILLTDDETIKDLNKRFRGLDEITDVLSFSNEYQGQYYGDKGHVEHSSENLGFVLPEDQCFQLGEVAISIPQAMRQTKNTLESELIKLVAHGFLHLLGYDHMIDSDREIMETLEIKAIKEVSDIV